MEAHASALGHAQQYVYMFPTDDGPNAADAAKAEVRGCGWWGGGGGVWAL